MTLVWCVLGFLTLTPVATGTKAGIKVRLTQPALDFGRQFLVDNLEEILKTYPIPGINKDRYGVNVTGLHFSELQELESELKFVPGKGIRFSVKDANINLQGHWKNNIIINDNGVFNVNVTLLNFKTTFEVDNDATGRPTFKNTDCHLQIRELNADTIAENHRTLGTRLTSLAQTLILVINKISPRTLPSYICSKLSMFAADITKDLTYHAIVRDYYEFDYSIVGPPHISSNFFDLAVKGVFYKIGQHGEPPFSPTDFPFLPYTDRKMLYIVVSDFTINSLSFVLHNDGVFSFDITDDMIPSGLPFRLSSTTFGAFIPYIAQHYQDQKMKLLIRTDNYPNITFDEKKATVHVSSTVTAYVIQSVSKVSPVFDLSLKASVSVELKVTEQKLTGATTLDTLDVNITKSEVGAFEVKKLEDFLKTVMTHFMIPIIDAYFKKGLLLPPSLVNQSLSFLSGTFEPVNTQVHILKDHLMFETDVKFTRQP